MSRNKKQSVLADCLSREKINTYPELVINSIPQRIGLISLSKLPLFILPYHNGRGNEQGY
ncbi:MAG: hypothetical protein APF81_20525 [Desulfosporosinus sp. BRH_c37]|nr:MAG: hypothetical protein APF81_20525 [Desulfosporosinus sp. BRH_c37]